VTTLWVWCLRNHSSLLRCTKQFSSSLKLPDWLLGPPNPVFNVHWRLFPLVERDWGMKLNTHHHSESRIRMNAAILALCNMPSWHAEGCYSLHISVENCTPPTFELIYFPNTLLVVPNTSFLDVHLLLTEMYRSKATRNTWNQILIFSVRHSTFNASNIVPNKSCNP